jgi:hypothetical protein
MIIIWIVLLLLSGIVVLILPSDAQALGGATVLLPATALVIAGAVLFRSHSRQLAFLALLIEAGFGLNYAGGLEGRARFPDYGSLLLLGLTCVILLWIPYQLCLTPLRWARRDGFVTPEAFKGMVYKLLPPVFFPFYVFLLFTLPTAVAFWVIPNSKLIQEGTLRLASLTVIFLACAQGVVVHAIRRFVEAHPGLVTSYARVPVSERSVLVGGIVVTATGCFAEVWRGDWILWVGSAVYLNLVVHTLAPLWFQKPFSFSRSVPSESGVPVEHAEFLRRVSRYALWLFPLAALYGIMLAIALGASQVK